MKVLAAAVQFAASSSKAENLAKVRRYTEEACRQGAKLVVLPEVFLWRGSKREEVLAAESLQGPSIRELACLATSFGIHLVCGSFLEKAGDGDVKVWNTSVLLDPKGEVLAVYRKVHLFDAVLPDGSVLKESETRKGGAEIVTAQTEFGRIGLSVCYDLRFPELYRALTLQGASIIMVPSAFTWITGKAHWEVLLRARAIENQVYVIAPNQVGRDGSGVLDYGNSMIVDPWGLVLARLSEGEGVILAELDLDYLKRVREGLPCLQHVRLIAPDFASPRRDIH